MITGALLLIAFIYYAYRKKSKSTAVPVVSKTDVAKVSESIIANDKIINTDITAKDEIVSTEVIETKGIEAIDTSNLSDNEIISSNEGEVKIYATELMPPPPAYSGPWGGPYVWAGPVDPPDGIYKITYIYS